MTRHLDKVRKRREDRADAERAKAANERKQIVERERQREQQDMQKRVYDMQVKKKMDQKKMDERQAEEAARLHDQMVEAQRTRQQLYDEETDEY